jgi:hypothetical protein
MKLATCLSFAATFSLALLLLAGCQTASPPKSAAIELFNGTNFDGWTFCMRSNSSPEKTWSVTNGVIHCTGRPYGYARTTQSYHDYKLTWIWRFIKVAPHADNTGMFVHTQPPDKVWPECIELQGQYQHQGDMMLHTGVSADGYAVAGKRATNIPQVGPSNENPTGDWGTNQAICSGHTITLFVNGKQMNRITGCNLTSGYIAVQCEGGDIEVQKITLEPLE